MKNPLPPEEREDPVAQAMREHPGHWIAWQEKTRRVLGIANSYTEIMQYVPDPDDPDLEIGVAPGFHPEVVRRPFTLLDYESPDILDDVKDIFENPDAWLDAPNLNFGGRKPRDLIGTDDEKHLRYLFRGIRQGITT